jgi:hypothetical protein
MRDLTRTRYAQILGLAFVAAGFIAIGLGWRGAADKACIDCQIPYLISGAAVGLGLIILGAVLLIATRVRVERMHLVDELARISPGAPAPPSEAPVTTGNGHVVVGGSTYHRPDCRLVREKAGLSRISVEAAESSGLQPCRVCHPELAEARGRSA